MDFAVTFQYSSLLSHVQRGYCGNSTICAYVGLVCAYILYLFIIKYFGTPIAEYMLMATNTVPLLTITERGNL